MKVTFLDWGPEIASSRLRAAIPQKELERMGVKKGHDVLIYGKHFLDDKYLSAFKHRIYDVCDDHYQSENLRDYYLKHTLSADVVTCNSVVMQRRIKEETGRNAVLVGEPYESPEFVPNIGPRLLWYGHKSNLKDLRRIQPELKHALLVLSNDGIEVDWEPGIFRQAIISPCIVIIPTGKSQAKSENRMVEAIRNGKYVCAERLPAYEPFDQFFPLGDIPSHIDRALTNQADSLARVRAAQDYIREKYSPHSIAQQWLKVIHDNFD